MVSYVSSLGSTIVDACKTGFTLFRDVKTPWYSKEFLLKDYAGSSATIIKVFMDSGWESIQGINTVFECRQDLPYCISGFSDPLVACVEKLEHVSTQFFIQEREKLPLVCQEAFRAFCLQNMVTWGVILISGLAISAGVLYFAGRHIPRGPVEPGPFQESIRNMRSGLTR